MQLLVEKLGAQPLETHRSNLCRSTSYNKAKLRDLIYTILLLLEVEQMKVEEQPRSFFFIGEDVGVIEWGEVVATVSCA